MKTNLLRNKKFRYGSFAVALTVAFLALAIVLNVIVSALATEYDLYVDMTSEQLYTLSEGVQNLLQNVEHDVNIYFCMEPDELEAQTEMRLVYNTAKQLESRFDFITVTCKDIIKENKFFSKFTTTSVGAPKTTSVIVEQGTEFRVYNVDRFYTFTESGTVFAYNGELRFASAILRLTADETPIAYFTVGHGETVNADRIKEGSSEVVGSPVPSDALITLMEDAGFEVRTVDLSREDLDPRARVLIINDPQYDFIGVDEAEAGTKSEIEKIDLFLDDVASVIVFSSPEYADRLTNLNEFLLEWGISFRAGTYLRDTENSLSVDGLSIVASYTEDTLGSSIYGDWSALSTTPKTVLRNCMPIDLVYESKAYTYAKRTVSPILVSADTAELHDNNDVIETGSYNLMTITRESRLVDEEYQYSYVVAAGSSSFAGNSYLSASFANKDILYASLRELGKTVVPAELDFKVFASDELAITTAAAARYTVLFAAVIPALVGIVGFVVYYRRKRA